MLKDASMCKIVFNYSDASCIQTIHRTIVNHVIEGTHTQNRLALAHAFESSLHADVDGRRCVGAGYERKRARIALDQDRISARNFKNFQAPKSLNTFFHQPKAGIKSE